MPGATDMKKTLACVLAAAFAMLSAFANAETYALIIGINDYPEPLDAEGKPLKDDEGNVISDDLFGCVNDAKFWKEMLTKNFGAKEANVHMLTDAQATEANFIKEFRWLIQSAKPGDRVFFSYSGHGAQVKLDDQPEETDGLTEVICLIDILIPDNFFGDVAKSFRDAGVDATFVFDSCFSGGIDRDAGKSKYVSRNKRVPADRLTARQRSNHLTAIEQAEMTNMVRINRAIAKGSYVFLQASQEDQTSSDVQWRDGSPSYGAFTYFVRESLMASPTLTIQQLLDKVKTTLKDWEFEQIPKAEYSDANRPKKPVVTGN